MITSVRNYAVAFSRWWHVVWMSMGYQLTRYGGGDRFGFILALLEPLILIGVLYIIRGLFRFSTPKYGTSLFLFLATGILPYYVFLFLSSRTRGAVGTRGRFPGLTALDAYIATILLNALVWIIMIVVIFLGMWLCGITEARPDSIVTSAVPILLLIVMAMGFGMINNVIMRYFFFWKMIYRVATRGLLFLSGVLFIVDLQPLWWRVWSIANPLSHGIEWFRLGVYGRYPHNSLDQNYLIECALIALFLGFVLDRAAIRLFARR